MTRQQDALRRIWQIIVGQSKYCCLGIEGEVNMSSDASSQPPGMQFASQVGTLAHGGKMVFDNTWAGCDSIILLIAAATDYRGDYPQKVCRQNLEATIVKTYDGLRKAHIADYQKLFQRVSLDLKALTPPSPLSQEQERGKPSVRAGRDSPSPVFGGRGR